jgi:hypothetical protein
MVCEVSIWLNALKVATLSLKVNGYIHKHDPSGAPFSTPPPPPSSGANLDEEEEDPLNDALRHCIPVTSNDRCFPEHSFSFSSSSSSSSSSSETTHSLNNNTSTSTSSSEETSTELGSVSLLICERMFDIACRRSRRNASPSSSTTTTTAPSTSSKPKASSSFSHASLMTSMKGGVSLQGVDLLHDVELYRSACKWGVPEPKSLSAGVYQVCYMCVYVVMFEHTHICFP